MAREAINTGAATLGLMSENVANMGQIRQNMLKQSSDSLNNIGKAFTEFGDRLLNEAQNRWLRLFKQAELDETKRHNQVSEKISQQTADANTAETQNNIESEREKRQGEIENKAAHTKLLRGQSRYYHANAKAQEFLNDVNQKGLPSWDNYLKNNDAKNAFNNYIMQSEQLNPQMPQIITPTPQDIDLNKGQNTTPNLSNIGQFGSANINSNADFFNRK